MCWLLSQRFGTHANGALIDQIWSAERPVGTRILTEVQGSDHRPAVATYALASAPGGI